MTLFTLLQFNELARLNCPFLRSRESNPITHSVELFQLGCRWDADEVGGVWGVGPSAQSRLRRVSGRVMRLAQRAAVETLMTTEQLLTVQGRWALRPTGVSAAEQGPSGTGKRMTHSV
jgi:hypothetical protein